MADHFTITPVCISGIGMGGGGAGANASPYFA